MATPDRRGRLRGHGVFAADALYTVLRAIARHAGSFYKALGIYIVSGATLAVILTWAFAAVAGQVQSGRTQRFDEAVLGWMAAHRIYWIERSLLEITALGTGLVVMAIVVVAALFLGLTEHRYSALLLLIATAGGIILNNVLKLTFARPRPQVFEWATDVLSSSFPSGHAMSSAIVYSTVAYLAARLQRKRWERALTMLVALGIIALVSVSRMYLGVHYPSDVIGGTVIGLAWAAFCMAGLEAVRVFAQRYRPRELRHERDLDPKERRASGLPP
ncbi:MAG: phosphatase PAP2 family protein [Gemmatimonadota bacterium]|nr:phosphatase PAP2 family protein [Gemmatimonadota bacterium]